MACARHYDHHQSARKHVLLTSLFDTKRYTAKGTAACYTQRWLIETSYRELKQTMRDMALILRRRTVDGVYQEIWGALTAYNLSRLEMGQGLTRSEMRADRDQFHSRINVIHYELHWAAVTRAYGKLPALM